jgi:hypothetical protein
MSALLDRLRIDNPGTIGRPPNPITHAYMLRFGLSEKKLRYTNFAQLGACKSDEARRLILGISR